MASVPGPRAWSQRALNRDSVFGPDGRPERARHYPCRGWRPGFPLATDRANDPRTRPVVARCWRTIGERCLPFRPERGENAVAAGKRGVVRWTE